MFATESDFELPCGFLDAAGVLHKTGVMRRATAADELAATRDHRVERNPMYLSVVLLARVVSRIGALEEINPGLMEQLYAQDFACLQRVYMRLNGYEAAEVVLECPSCHTAVKAKEGPMGEWAATL
jgi:hypothetical protein